MVEMAVMHTALSLEVFVFSFCGYIAAVRMTENVSLDLPIDE